MKNSIDVHFPFNAIQFHSKHMHKLIGIFTFHGIYAIVLELWKSIKIECASNKLFLHVKSIIYVQFCKFNISFTFAFYNIFHYFRCFFCVNCIIITCYTKWFAYFEQSPKCICEQKIFPNSIQLGNFLNFFLWPRTKFHKQHRR